MGIDVELKNSGRSVTTVRDSEEILARLLGSGRIHQGGLKFIVSSGGYEFTSKQCPDLLVDLIELKTHTGRARAVRPLKPAARQHVGKLVDLVRQACRMREGSVSFVVDQTIPISEQRMTLAAELLFEPAEIPAVATTAARHEGFSVKSAAWAGSGADRDSVIRILESFDLVAKLTKLGLHRNDGDEIVVDLFGPVPEKDLTQAHGGWVRCDKVKTPKGFPRQKCQTPLPATAYHVTVSCIRARSGGMSSHYGFTGYYISLLVDMDEEAIWDARYERAQ